MVKKIKIELPKIPVHLEKINFQDIYYEEDPQLLNGAVIDTEIHDERLDRAVFSKVIFKNVTFLNADFNKIDMMDVIFENCNLSNSRLCEGIVHRVAFKDCKLLGIDLSNANFGNVSF